MYVALKKIVHACFGHVGMQVLTYTFLVSTIILFTIIFRRKLLDKNSLQSLIFRLIYGNVSFNIIFDIHHFQLLYFCRNQLRGASKPAFAHIRYYLSPVLYSVKIKEVYATTGTKSAKSLWFTCSPYSRSFLSNSR